MAQTLTTPEVMTRLSVKYQAPEWAFMPQVPDGTGSLKRRTADALAMNLWPSRGLEFWGFEVKVQRGDWLREMKMPQKSEGFMHYCDRWWLVVGNKDIIKDGELPSTWGLLVPHGAGPKIVTPAPLLHEKQVAFDRAFVAGVFRVASQTITWDSKLREAYQDGAKYGRKQEKELLQHDIERHDKLKERLKQFEESSGISISSYIGMESATRMGEAVRMVMSGGITEVTSNLDLGIRMIEQSLKSMKKTREQMRGPDQGTIVPGEQV